MKRIITALICLALIFSFCACGKDKKPENLIIGRHDKKGGEYTEEYHISVMIESGLFTGNLNDYSQEQKEKIRGYLSEDGYSIEYKTDGSAVLTRSGNTWFVAAGWVKNEYTAGVPEPDFGEITMSMNIEENNEEYYAFQIRSRDENGKLLKYIQSLMKLGYKPVEIYTEGSSEFRGKNAAGKKIELFFSGQGYMLRIALPRANETTTTTAAAAKQNTQSAPAN